MLNELVGRVFATRNAAHLLHFSTGSYAAHMALGDFYEAIVEQIDEVVEVCQGKFGPMGYVAMRSAEFADVESCIAHLVGETSWITAHRNEIARGFFPVENLLDELTAEYARTTYKLRQLK